MIKLFKVKEKQREQAENASGGPPVKKQSAGELRLHKGFLLFINWSGSCMLYFTQFVWHSKISKQWKCRVQEENERSNGNALYFDRT